MTVEFSVHATALYVRVSSKYYLVEKPRVVSVFLWTRLSRQKWCSFEWSEMMCKSASARMSENIEILQNEGIYISGSMASTVYQGHLCSKATANMTSGIQTRMLYQWPLGHGTVWDQAVRRLKAVHSQIIGNPIRLGSNTTHSLKAFSFESIFFKAYSRVF